MDINKKGSLPIIQNKRIKCQANTLGLKYVLNNQMQSNRHSLQFLSDKDNRIYSRYDKYRGGQQAEQASTNYLQSIVFRQSEQQAEQNAQLNFRKQRIVYGLSPSDIDQYYSEQIKNKQLTKDKLKGLMRRLIAINPLLQKISIVVIQALLQIGSIKTYSSHQYVYKQNHPVKFIGILLWGQAILKYKNCKRTFNFIAGNSIGQQLIFQKIDLSSKKFSTMQKGEFLSKQRCKAVKNSAFLFIEQNLYDQMIKNFIRWGLKNQIEKKLYKQKAFQKYNELNKIESAKKIKQKEH